MSFIVNHEISKLHNYDLYSKNNKIIYHNLPILYRYHQNYHILPSSRNYRYQKNSPGNFPGQDFVYSHTFTNSNLGGATSTTALNRTMNSRERTAHMQKHYPGYKPGLLDSMGFSKSDLTLPDGKSLSENSDNGTAETTPRSSFSSISWDGFEQPLSRHQPILSTHKSTSVNYIPPISESKEVQTTSSYASSETQTEPMASGLPFKRQKQISFTSRRIEPGAFRDYMRPTLASVNKYVHAFKPAGRKSNT